MPEKGKFGLIEKAHEGTLFLDEIGDMSLKFQAKFLRVLEEGKFTRLGDHQEISVNIRVIAATNIDLAKALKKGTFRSDLFYRPNVVPIKIPPRRKDLRI